MLGDRMGNDEAWDRVRVAGGLLSAFWGFL